VIALDTNVLARLVTRDDPRQAHAAAELIDRGETCFVPLTVALELEWVLRGVYELEPERVAESFNALLGVRNLHFEREAAVLEAVRLLADGFDFADVLHHAASGNCESFRTFDRKLLVRAERVGLTPPVRLIGD
jgi:predicted nucleic-acid-binding protein